MLTILCGTKGSERTQALLDRMTQAIANGQEAVLLVPEQASFSYEKRLRTALGKASERGKAVSFSRYAQLLLRQLGGRRQPPVEETAALFFLHIALEELSDLLVVYGRQVYREGFLREVLSLLTECQNAGISAAELALFALSQPEGLLRDKIHELSMIAESYEAVVTRSDCSTKDDLTLAAEALAGSGMLQNTIFLVDDFGGFTAPELVFLEALLRESAGVTVSLCCDSIVTTAPAFALARDTVSRLRRIAEQANDSLTEWRLPETSHHSAALAALEWHTRLETIPTEPAGEGVTAYACPHPHAELTTVAATIAALVRQGYRYREIAVIARNLDRYRTALPSVFSRYEIPFFWDEQQDAAASALVQGVLAAVAWAGKARDADPLLLAGHPMLGLDPLAVGELDNYCYIWSIATKDWERPFLQHPDGITDRMTPEVAARQARIEALRQTIVTPILALRTAMAAGTGLAFATGLWQYLETIGTKAHLLAVAATLPAEEGREFLETQSLLWESLTEILELFAGLPIEVALTPDRAGELLRLALGSVKVAIVPRTLDQVMVGTADRMRTEAPRAVVLLGAVEGEFPLAAVPGGMLTDTERQLLVESGLSLLTESKLALATEAAFCYRAVTAATEQVIVTMPLADAKGGVLAPSELFLRAAALSPATALPPLFEVQTKAAATLSLAAAIRQEEGGNKALLSALLADAPAEQQLLERIAQKLPHHLTTPGLSSALFGKKLRLSPSRVEQYFRCPFPYFAQKGLGTLPRRKAELSPAEAGTLIHRVLEVLVSRYGGKGLAEVPHEQLAAEVTAETKTYLSEVIGSEIPSRLEENFYRLGVWLTELLERMGQEFAQSQFVPAAFELPIGAGKAIEPLLFPLPEDGSVTLEGIIDRVDLATIDGKKYLRIIDYKSGQKKFLLTDIAYGLNLQMLLYLFSVSEQGTGEFSDLTPAGALYLPAQGSYLSADRNEAAEALEKKRQKLYRMNGLLLSDPAVLQAMEQQLGGVYIPTYKPGKEGDTFYSLSELGRLRRLVEEKVVEMGRALQEGEIAAVPAVRGNESPCLYCDYRTICGFEAGDAVKPLLSLDRETVLGKEGE